MKLQNYRDNKFPCSSTFIKKNLTFFNQLGHILGNVLFIKFFIHYIYELPKMINIP